MGGKVKTSRRSHAKQKAAVICRLKNVDLLCVIIPTFKLQPFKTTKMKFQCLY